MRTLFADLRYAFRVASRTPSFAVAVVCLLALGIGASTTIFSIVNAVLLRPLPFEEPERLVRIFTRTPGGRLFELSPGKFYDWQRDARSFEGMAMYQCCGFREVALTGTGTARPVHATAVGAGFLETVRARPALGRVFDRRRTRQAARRAHSPLSDSGSIHDARRPVHAASRTRKLPVSMCDFVVRRYASVLSVVVGSDPSVREEDRRKVRVTGMDQLGRAFRIY